MISIRSCTPGDLTDLQKTSIKTFKDAFACMNTEKNMNAFLEGAYNAEKLKRELSNEASLFFFLYFDNVLAGYLKLNESPAQTDIHDPASLEIERIYVLSDFQGTGLGHYLINFAVKTARERNKDYIWLGVWEKNKKALSFYKKHGFFEIGAHDFVMGDDVQTDFLMRKDI